MAERPDRDMPPFGDKQRWIQAFGQQRFQPSQGDSQDPVFGQQHFQPSQGDSQDPVFGQQHFQPSQGDSQDPIEILDSSDESSEVISVSSDEEIAMNLQSLRVDPTLPDETGDVSTAAGRYGHRIPYVDYLYAFEIPFTCTEQRHDNSSAAVLPVEETYKMVKVGASTKPGKRFSQFRSGFSQTTRGNCSITCMEGIPLSGNVPPEEVIEYAKERNEFLFVIGFCMHPCYNVNSNPDRLNAESMARRMLGAPIFNPSDFFDSLKKTIAEPQKFVKNCGPTEWIVCQKDTIDKVKEEFVEGRLDGPWNSWDDLITALGHVLGVDMKFLNVYIDTGNSTKLQAQFF